MINHKTIAKAYGVKINYQRSPIQYFNWDGTQINAKGLPAHNILHEIAHYIISPKKYRKYINFYLGRGPDEDYTMYKNTLVKSKPNRPIERKNAQLEEDLTCALEFIFGALYQNIKTIENTLVNRQYMYHTISGAKWLNGPKDLIQNIEMLQRKRLIDKNWVPIQLKKSNLVTEKHLSNLEKFKKFICY